MRLTVLGAGMALEFRHGGYSSPPDNAVIFIETGSRTGLFVVGKVVGLSYQSSNCLLKVQQLSTELPDCLGKIHLCPIQFYHCQSGFHETLKSV